MDMDLNVRDESVFADRRIDCESLHSFDSDLLDSDSDSDLFDSDSDSDLFDSDSEAVATVPNWGDLPHEMQWNIFQYVEPGQYLYVALTCKLFRELYKDACKTWKSWTKGWNFTLYRNGVASIGCAALAMESSKWFQRVPDWRLPLISGAILMNCPDVLEWMFANDWFCDVTADLCAHYGCVEVILWMWIHGPFHELDSDRYDPTLAKYIDEDGKPKLETMKHSYDARRYRVYPTEIPGTWLHVPYALPMAEVDRLIDARFREGYEVLDKDEFWGFNHQRD